MKIVVINGTEVRGCTHHIKEAFLEGLRQDSEIQEFYLPKDQPHFCRGCKTCFFQSELKCPHAEYVMPIWNAMLDAELLVFTSPVYALRATGQMKALLDHFCVHWMVHRPDDRMFTKKAVILTNAIGVLNGAAQKDMATSLSWLGVSDIKRFGVGLMEGVVWNELSDKRKKSIVDKVERLSRRYSKPYNAGKGIIVAMKFLLCRMMHKAIAKNESPLSADNQHWVDKGWVKL
ncbi:flavodoxin family protein [Bacillota bacterium Meth-B3]